MASAEVSRGSRLVFFALVPDSITHCILALAASSRRPPLPPRSTQRAGASRRPCSGFCGPNTCGRTGARAPCPRLPPPAGPRRRRRRVGRPAQPGRHGGGGRGSCAAGRRSHEERPTRRAGRLVCPRTTPVVGAEARAILCSTPMIAWRRCTGGAQIIPREERLLCRRRRNNSVVRSVQLPRQGQGHQGQRSPRRPWSSWGACRRCCSLRSAGLRNRLSVWSTLFVCSMLVQYNIVYITGSGTLHYCGQPLSTNHKSRLQRTLQVGMGADQHGQDATKAAVR